MKGIKFTFLITTILIGSMSCNKTQSVGYSGEDISKSAKIIRDQTTKKAYLVFNEDLDKWKLVNGNSLANIQVKNSILEGSNKENDTIEIPVLANHQLFELITQNGTCILAEEHLPMAGGYNFRDLGGLKTQDNRFVNWGMILRSDDLHNLQDQDLDYLSSFPLKTIVDFRADTEIKAAPDKLPSSVENHELLSITPGNVLDFQKLETLDAAQVHEVMKDLNIALVTDSSSIRQYQKYFALLQDTTKIPLLFHCSAGKDRTGMAAALTLYALGVSEETIYENYLESNYYLKDKYQPYKDKYPNMSALFEVHKDFLQAALEQLKKDYGSIDNYLIDILGVDTLKLRNIYLNK